MAAALGLWRALSPDVLGRIGAGALFVAGLGSFLDGLFRLDCQGIDAGCVNDSWHADAHRWESRFTAAAILLAPLILAFAFRRLPEWRRAWLPSLATLPLIILANVVFSTLGTGAATRAGTVCLVPVGGLPRSSAHPRSRKEPRQDRGLRWAARA
jgi:Protein of unknown function (DUF998)